LASLQQYVLVDIPSRRVESFRRTPDDQWLPHVYLVETDTCRFPCLNLSGPLAEIFEDVMPEDAPETPGEPSV
jgi:Uma2 family endonuclease